MNDDHLLGVRVFADTIQSQVTAFLLRDRNARHHLCIGILYCKLKCFCRAQRMSFSQGEDKVVMAACEGEHVCAGRSI